jgi:TonB-linked SusC/RagA family outer membrane protein
MRKFLSLLAVLVMCFFFALAQNTEVVTGRVTDQQGQPVPFASVRIKSTKAGVSADDNGVFSIRAKPGDVLVVSGAGITETESVVTGSVLNFHVELRRTNLSEVVVTALGQTQSKVKTGYSTQTFNSQTINRNAAVGVLDGLEGKISGAEISSIGGPGASTKVVLRSYGIISGGNNQPLYVIDGAPLTDGQFEHSNAIDGADYGNGINNINPNDVESVTVLKGTAASSLYGGLAKNGVVMITTKKGRAGKIRVDYNGSANISRVGKLPTYQDEFGQGWGGVFVLSENGSWGPRLDGKERLWGSVVDNSQLLKPFSAIKDPLRKFYTTGSEFNNSISFSGGSEATRFYFSYSNVVSDGVIPTKSDYLARNTLALRTNSNFGRFAINTSINYVDQNLKVPNTGQSTASGGGVFESLLQIPVDIPITDFKDYKNKFFNVDNYFTPYADNPYFGLYENGNKQGLSRIFGNVDLEYKFTSDLSAQLRVGGDFSNARTFEWKQPNAAADGTWRGVTHPTNVEGQPATAEVGQVFQGSDYYGVVNADFIVKYKRSLGTDFSLEALAGANYFQSNQRSETAEITNLIVPGFFNLSNTSKLPTVTDNLVNYRNMGLYAQAILGWKDQLYLTGNIRNDWSSTLPIDHNSILYPGVNASWLASQNFQSNQTVSFLKFHAAYGRTGSSPTAYQTYARLGSGTVLLYDGNMTFPFNGVAGFGIANTIYNPSLKPIFTDELEAGVEIGLFHDIIRLEATGYNKKTKGQIFSLPIAPSTGYTALVENIGQVTNKGIELTLNVRPVNTANVEWSFTYLFTKNFNNVDYLSGDQKNPVLTGVYDAELRAVVGKSVASIYAPVPQKSPDGKIVVSAVTGLPIVNTTPLDQYGLQNGYYGSGLPDYTMGFTNMVRYKDFSLNFSLDFRYGGVMYSQTAQLSQFVGNSKSTVYNDRKPFIIPNSVNAVTDGSTGKTTYVENKTFIGNAGGAGQSDNYYEYFYISANLGGDYQNLIFDRSFLKLRDVNLSYRLPSNLAAKIGMSSASIGIYGRNFLLWTPTANIYIDPEATNIGNDLLGNIGEFATAPLSKSYGVVLKLSF